jgi:hypothetical protein
LPSLLEEIAEELEVPLDVIKEALARAHWQYRKFRVRKHSGGYREIVQPAPGVKIVQKWLSMTLLSKMPVHSAATAYRKGCSIRANAHLHRKYRYSVRLDFEKFFPSISSADLFEAICQTSQASIQRFVLPEWQRIIELACFDASKRLPIGYSTSPEISNAVMHSFDDRVARLLQDKRASFGEAIFSRYADDIVFSTDVRGACKTFAEDLGALARAHKSPALALNLAKTRLMSRGAGTSLVTGLRLGYQGNVTLHRRYKDGVRLMLSLYARKSLKPEDVSKLRGHLAYIEGVDGAFLTKLAARFPHALALLRPLP